MVDHQNKQSHIPQPVSQDAKIHYDLQIFLRENGKLFHWNEMLIWENEILWQGNEILLRGKEIIILWNGLWFCGKEMIYLRERNSNALERNITWGNEKAMHGNEILF